VSDFPIIGGEFVDVNVKSHTQYYYTIRVVETAAQINLETQKMTGEKVGPAGMELPLETDNILMDQVALKNFILMQIANPLMRVNEATVEIDPGRGTTPVLLNSRTLVPIRAIVETIGGSVDWDETEQKITLAANGRLVEMWLERTEILADGESFSIDVAPTTVNDRTMLPVRFVVENLGCQIEWIGSSEEVIVVF
jgi:hypothetical protein